MRFHLFRFFIVQLAAWWHTDTETRKHCNTVALRLPGQVWCVDCKPCWGTAFNNDMKSKRKRGMFLLVLPALMDSGSVFCVRHA